jgi:NADH:ubiquinone oxidoreductase subunit K
MIRLPLVLFFSAALFAIGVYGVLARRNAVLVLMSIELMLNAVNVNLVAFSQVWWEETLQTGQVVLGSQALAGQVFALFVITVAAAEVGIGLAIVILIFRNRETINVDEIDLLKW